MQVEKIKLGEGISLPVKLMQVMNVASGEELTVLYSEAGMMIMKPLSNLTDILSHLLPTEGEECDSEEYEEYILHRSGAWAR
ncbi:MAG: hypothetical protein NWE82_01260 [Candidatus Bathyarchaeota archaeon]|nr:hypothetical protein [Candidatus Bathyarchaeota archaeon]